MVPPRISFHHKDVIVRANDIYDSAGAGKHIETIDKNPTIRAQAHANLDNYRCYPIEALEA